jgi:hypothetical protein
VAGSFYDANSAPTPTHPALHGWPTVKLPTGWAQLREQRAELRLRAEIAEALGAFREEASRRARPTLEH